MDLSGEGPDPRWLTVSRAHVRGLRGRYRQHVIDYTGEGHAVINGWLRGAALSRRSADYARSRTASLDAVLAAIPLTRAMHVTRVVGIRATFGLNDGHDLDRIVGQPRMEAGFLSTSRMRTYPVKNRADPILLDVDVPAGTPAAALEDVSRYPEQCEILLGRNLGYVILTPQYDRNVGWWRATMLIGEE
ncbi:ADP-ribosyltransferase [Gordonia sp. (in: high G+C Gram-positive bacteria)]|uniref:ADP-ribosyltransferase n=1 Tax=Gordonia sp. (in: high G+C Gram-positive bacteria) TaxID=84139 RepID=UPI00260838EF|nr:ADP-ribosyltransferase [Gordonia sp. (in: high G+C Gram-positive bacteria)]